MPTTIRHEPTDECNGEAARMPATLAPDGVACRYVCQECAERLCWCELTYGHECGE